MLDDTTSEICLACIILGLDSQPPPCKFMAIILAQQTSFFRDFKITLHIILEDE